LNAGSDAGQLYANWQFNQPKAVLLEDAYVNNNGILYGRPEFVEDGERGCFAFNGKDQYAEAPPSVADFGALTVDMAIRRAAGKGGRLFDFGTGKDECFYLDVAADGKATLAARHAGKEHALAALGAVPAGAWARVRVEMDGATASIHVDGKQVVKKKFAFRPRDVFIGDRPEGNFIACGREKDSFFAGRIDHFRIYRTVHEDFASVGRPPTALTIIQEWSEKDQKLSEAWEARRKATDAEAKKGKYAEIQKEVRKLHQEKSALYRSEKIKELEAGIRKADQARHAMERKKGFGEKDRAGEPYKKAQAACAAARKALDEERKRLREEKADEAAKLDKRIASLHKDAHALWEKAMRSAGVYGGNPYPGKRAADMAALQKSMVYHTSASWEDRTREEVENRAPEKMKKWLKRVRGY
jgi:hypothetical protein